MKKKKKAYKKKLFSNVKLFSRDTVNTGLFKLAHYQKRRHRKSKLASSAFMHRYKNYGVFRYAVHVCLCGVRNIAYREGNVAYLWLSLVFMIGVILGNLIFIVLFGAYLYFQSDLYELRKQIENYEYKKDRRKRKKQSMPANERPATMD